MNKYKSVVDPAAEIEKLKALEKAKLSPVVWPAPVKAKAKKWPAAPDIAKLKAARPQVWRPMMDDAESAPWQPGGVPTADAIRAVIILAALIAVALGID